MNLRDSFVGRWIRSHARLHRMLHATWCRALTHLDTRRVASSGGTAVGAIGGGPGSNNTYTGLGLINPGYEVLSSQTNLSAVLTSGIPDLASAVQYCTNFQNNTNPPPILYIFSVSPKGVIAFVQSVSPDFSIPTDNVNLEIYDYYGVSVSNVQYASFAKAQTALEINYQIVPPPGIGATGTYLIYDDATGRQLAYGAIVSIIANPSPSGGVTQPSGGQALKPPPPPPPTTYTPPVKNPNPY